MRLIVTAPATRDLGDIVDYITLESPRASERVYRAIVSAAQRLLDFPGMGRVGRLPNTRELSVISLPYVIVYAVAGETVTILAVFHGARDLTKALQERRGAREL